MSTYLPRKWGRKVRGVRATHLSVSGNEKTYSSSVQLSLFQPQPLLSEKAALVFSVVLMFSFSPPLRVRIASSICSATVVADGFIYVFFMMSEI